jgi:hypothetical protein
MCVFARHIPSKGRYDSVSALKCVRPIDRVLTPPAYCAAIFGWGAQQPVARRLTTLHMFTMTKSLAALATLLLVTGCTSGGSVDQTDVSNKLGDSSSAAVISSGIENSDGRSAPPAQQASAAPGGLYVGYYQEDASANPEDPTAGAFSLNLPETDTTFAGSMYFTYVGCQTSNVGNVTGRKKRAALSGTWSGRLDGSPQSGAYVGSYNATTGSYSGTFTTAGGKQFRDLRPCIQYWIAPNGRWEMFSVGSETPANTLNVAVTGRRVNWTAVSGGAHTLVYVLDETVALGRGNPVLWQTLLTTGTAVVIPNSVALRSGKVYVVAVGVSNRSTERLAFASKRFTQP